MLARGVGLLIGFTIAYLMNKYADKQIWGEKK